MKKHLPRINDRLSEIVRDLSQAGNKEEFYSMIRELKARGKCKPYMNREKKLPPGIYVEVHHFAGSSERIVVGMDRFSIFPTRTHYRNFAYAKSPEFADTE